MVTKEAFMNYLDTCFGKSIKKEKNASMLALELKKTVEEYGFKEFEKESGLPDIIGNSHHETREMLIQFYDNKLKDFTKYEQENGFDADIEERLLEIDEQLTQLEKYHKEIKNMNL